MSEIFNKNTLYNSAQSNFKKKLEVVYSNEISAGQPLKDSKFFKKIQDMTEAMNEPMRNCYFMPQLFKDCSEGNYDKIKHYIINYCDINAIGPDGKTALACAISANNVPIVELLLKSGANPNSIHDKMESTPLMDASNVGYTDIVRLLLEFGGNPDVKSSTNNTALHSAACGGHYACCKFILDSSSNPQALIEEKNEDGHTALMEAATNGFLETTKFLVESGAQINIPSVKFKETALTLASFKGYSDILTYLLEAGADYDHRTDEMHTALMEASMEGHIESTKVLLYYGALVNMRSGSFESPLTLAACSGNTDLATYLINYGANIEEVNYESYTPLMEAARGGHLETVAMLLSLGANINRVTEKTQETALTLAACAGFYDIILLLHRCGADIELGSATPLMESSQEGHLEIVKALLTMGAKIDAKNSNYETSLHFAAEKGHVEVCKYLLDHNADIHHISEGGRTCLMNACRAGHLDVVIFLVDKGSRIDQMTNVCDHNALSLACANGHFKVVEYLLKMGADPTSKLKDNCTVLIEASRAGHIDVIEILLQDNNRINLIDSLHNNIANDIASINSHYICNSASTTPMNSSTELYNVNKLMNITLDMRMQPPLQTGISNYSSLTNTCTDNSFPSTIQQLSPFNSYSLSDLVDNDSQIFVDDYTNSFITLAQSSILPTKFPDPPINSSPVSLNYLQTSLYQSTTELVNLPMSKLNYDNDKLFQNMVDINSPNLEEWVKYIYPNLNNDIHVTDLKLPKPQLSCLTSPQVVPHQYLNSHFCRKIKKARHSENYSLQFNATLPNNNCVQSQFENSLIIEKYNNLDLEYSESCKFLPCVAERSAYSSEDMNCDINYQNIISVNNNTESNDDFNHPCKESNKFQFINTSKENHNGTFSTKNFFFSYTDHSTPVKQIRDSYSSLIDSGIFSIDKSIINGQSPTDFFHDEYHTDIKRIFNYDTPTRICSLKPNVSSPVLSSIPFHKQVLQPKRRLQQTQSSRISDSSSIPTCSLLPTDRQISSQQIKLISDSFIISTTNINDCAFDLSIHTSQESFITNGNFNIPENKLSTPDNDNLLKNSDLCDFKTNLTITPIVLVSNEYNNNYEQMTTDYHLELMDSSSNIVDHSNSITTHTSATFAMNSNESEKNLEMIEKLVNEYNDDYENEKKNHDDPSVEITSGISSNCSKTKFLKKNRCKKKLNVNVCMESLQETPLSLACSGGHIEVVKVLIASGAKLEHRDKKSQTPLHIAVLNSHLEVTRLLLESGADIEAMVEQTKDTALSMSCANGNFEIVKELINRGANFEHRNVSDYTPLSLAASGGFVDIITFLLNNNSDINSRMNSKLGISPLMLAAMNGHYEAVSILLDNGSDINAQIETNKNTALTLSCFQGRDDIVSLLIDRKAYIEHRAKSGLTPLMEAASQGHVNVGRILIGAGADVNAPPVLISRETALIIAAEKGHTDFVRLLLRHGTVVDSRNKKGATPLWLASHGGYIEIVKILIDAMSDPNSADNRRITCLVSAFKKGHVIVVKELIKYATQFPSENDCVKYTKIIKNQDKDLFKRCEACKEIIFKAKERQEYEAAKNAKDLLKQVEDEKRAKEQKEVKQARKRQKKKVKKKAKHEDNDVEISNSTVNNTQDKNGYTIARFFSQYLNVTPSINDENINSHNLPIISNKILQTKLESEKTKTNDVEEYHHDKLKNEMITTSLKVDSFANDYIIDRTSILVSDDNNSLINNENNIKKNSWIELNSSKIVIGTKVEENPSNCTWQKIGSNKKKLDIKMNKKDIGKVIGQGGSVVNAIRHITGAHIDIDSMANDLDERTVHLKGSVVAVTKAKDYICDLVDNNIIGSTVIKESEHYISKMTLLQREPLDNPLNNSTVELDYSKAVNSTSISLAQHNGKVNAFVYPKFGVQYNNSQYGFSKSVKVSEFTSAVAAGIVNVPYSDSSVQRMNYNSDSSTNNNFPSLSDANVDLCPSNEYLAMSTSNLNNEMTYTNIFVNDPLKVNVNITQQTSSHNNMSKTFPLAPGSERSIHLRTYNSTPEHSPQIDFNSKNELASSDSTISDKDDAAENNRFNKIISDNILNNIKNSRSSNNNKKNFQEPGSFCDPITDLDFEVMNHYPKFQYLNPKAEEFSPSFAAINNNNLYLNTEDFLYNINGTLSLNPTANIFKPRQQNLSNYTTLATSLKCSDNVEQGNNKNNIVHTSKGVAPPQKERLIRLQDHINMAINILLRTNGYDHNMAEAAFLSFMRSANLDINTRLTIAEFTSLINNIINQSNNPSSTLLSPPITTIGFLPSKSLSSYDENISRLLSTQSQSQFRLINQPLTTSQTHWPSIITNFNSQSIWAPVSNNGRVLTPTPFFPSVNQCLSAQAAFNSPLLLSLTNESSSSYLPQSVPPSYDNVINGNQQFVDCITFKSDLSNGNPIPSSDS